MKITIKELQTFNTAEEENKLLRQNLHSLQRRNHDLEEINRGYMELTERQKKESENLSHETQQLAGTIVGKHNKKH